MALMMAAVATAQITTSQYDNARTGANLNEKILMPKNVNRNSFGKLGAFKVDGAVYAQPLYVPNLDIPGKGRHNVLYVATEHDSVYAFDADHPGQEPLWRVSLLDPNRQTTAVRDRDVQCPFIQPEIGVTSTPVIDMKTGTLYVLARTYLSKTFGFNEYFQHLHALAITTGVEKFGGPKPIEASVQGKGAGSSGGVIAFNALRENPRAALTLVNGNVILTWASSCDVDPYHGWIMAYDAQTLAQKAVLNVTPDGSEGGIWASDAGPVADADSNIYVPTANGTFSADKGGRDYGDTVLKLDSRSLAIRDYYTPSNQEHLSEEDADLGSSGPTLLPDQSGAHKHILLQPGKDGVVYVIDRDNMGKFRPSGDAIIQKIKVGDGVYGAMAYWNGHAYVVGSDDYLRDFSVSGAGLKEVGRGTRTWENPGATPAVSADGTKNAILWVIATKTWNGRERAAILYAYDVKNIAGDPLYTSEQNGTSDRAAPATRFVVPLVVNGRVYFGARGEVEAYGLK